MRFLVDAQLPRAFAAWLSQQGHDALHTLDLPDENRTTDARICALADAEDRVVVTKDADFVSSHGVAGTPARLLLISTGNIANRELLALVQVHWRRIETALEQTRFVELTSARLISRG